MKDSTCPIIQSHNPLQSQMLIIKIRCAWGKRYNHTVHQGGRIMGVFVGANAEARLTDRDVRRASRKGRGTRCRIQ
jgi:hypothetical protein